MSTNAANAICADDKINTNDAICADGASDTDDDYEPTQDEIEKYLRSNLSQTHEVFSTISGCIGFTLAYGNFFKTDDANDSDDVDDTDNLDDSDDADDSDVVDDTNNVDDLEDEGDTTLGENEEYLSCCWKRAIDCDRFYGKILFPIRFRFNRYGEKIQSYEKYMTEPIQKLFSDYVRSEFFSSELKNLLYADSYRLIKDNFELIHSIRPDLHEMDDDTIEHTGKSPRFCMIPSDCYSCT